MYKLKFQSTLSHIIQTSNDPHFHSARPSQFGVLGSKESTTMSLLVLTEKLETKRVAVSLLSIAIFSHPRINQLILYIRFSNTEEKLRTSQR